MKYLFLFITICYSIALSAQIYEDFSDQELSNNPTWNGDLSDFELGDAILNLDADSAGKSILYTPLNFTAFNNLEWSLDLNMDFSPSNNNYLNVLLYAQDSLHVDSSLHDVIYFHIGENGSDDAMEVYYYSSFLNEHILICRGVEGNVGTAFSKHIKIRYSNGEWSLFSRDIESPYLIQEAAAFYTNDLLEEGFFAMEMNYTNSNVEGFHFDNLYVGEIFFDEFSPSIDSICVENEYEILLFFSEPVDSIALNENNYFLSPTLSLIQNASFLSSFQSTVRLLFNEAFIPWEVYTLSIDSLNDLNGNFIESLSQDFVYSPSYVATYGELQFSEIMPDPTPPVGLPSSEYIEIVNLSDSILQLENYKLVNSGVESILPSFQLFPDSFLLLGKLNEVANFADYGAILPINNWQSLVNSGDSLVLKSSKDEVLDIVFYRDDWFEDPLKAEGGWSLERIDFTTSCMGKVNWKESQAIIGGSPGKLNSVFGMEIENDILFRQAYLLSDEKLFIEFDGEIDSSRFEESEVLSMPQMFLDWDTYELNNDGLSLTFSPAILSGEKRDVKIKGLVSCQGESLDDFEFTLAFSQGAQRGDIVINEILFNAYSGAHDFLEIYNKSDKFIDLKDWRVNELWNGILIEDARLSEKTRILKPGEWMVFSEEPDELPELYPYANSKNIFEVKDFPTFPDDEGELHLLNDDFLIIDSLIYSEEMHFSLLEDKNGVSLERIHPDKESFVNANWISASENVDFATPGMQNSHFLSQIESGGIYLDPISISPNNDGVDDVLQIHYNFNTSGWLGNVQIFNDKGVLVNDLIARFWMSNKGSFIWDGLNDKNEKLGLGIYIVYIEVFNEAGEMHQFKRACVVE